MFYRKPNVQQKCSTTAYNAEVKGVRTVSKPKLRKTRTSTAGSWLLLKLLIHLRQRTISNTVAVAKLANFDQLQHVQRYLPLWLCYIICDHLIHTYSRLIYIIEYKLKFGYTRRRWSQNATLASLHVFDIGWSRVTAESAMFRKTVWRLATDVVSAE